MLWGLLAVIADERPDEVTNCPHVLVTPKTFGAFLDLSEFPISPPLQ